MSVNGTSNAQVALISLYSKQYPAIGESHGLSVVAGALEAALPADQLQMRVLDMVQWGVESSDRAVELIHEVKANILAVGLPYGTFSVFQREYPAMRSALYGSDPLVVLGGPIATYLSDRILHEIAPNAVIIVGEAEQALPAVIQAWLRRRPMADIPNLHYIDRRTSSEIRTPRRLADLAVSSLPHRAHIHSIYEKGGQIYTESSRGCSWAACTFCLRGLTDIAGRGHEYRRKQASLIASDLRALSELGITDVTFADEDFLGSPLASAEHFIDSLQLTITNSPKFDASLTIHSVCSRRDTADERYTRQRLLAKLAQMGLQKVFLGIESCSGSQLKRYAKGHTREEAVAATRMLQQLGIRVEIGVILFDPLCTLDEVEDSLRFMRDNDLVRLASGISSELRLQKWSHYMMMLRKYEAQHNVKLCSGELDADTLSYPYTFADKSVQGFFNAVGRWNRRLHPLYYPAKSLSRFGATGAMGSAVYPLREATERFRDASCDALLQSISAIKTGADGEAVLDQCLGRAAASLAHAVLGSLSALTPEQAQHPVVQQAAAAAATDASLGPKAAKA